MWQPRNNVQNLIFVNNFSVGRPSRRGEKRRDYDPLKLQMAVEAVSSGLMNPSKAAAYFKVPRATIYLRMKNTGMSNLNSGIR